MKLIKRYPNRRLYDTDRKGYITLLDVRGYIKSYEPFQVVDSKSGDDITRQVLLQVLSDMESEGHESVLTNKFLEEIIRLYDTRMTGMAGQWLEQAMVGWLSQQQRWQQELKRMQDLNPANMFSAFFTPSKTDKDN
ncbi:polyhydroxyalkanoate synthesis repressor PhaR [Ferrimonas pelagia]|uniref:Polyhydroxyalkanoate synthesis repressor PhaR n=1 Tax=Ferrimonas pelagia TaxID=1177826 RepID=A0ABP9F430_9GAMM